MKTRLAETVSRVEEFSGQAMNEAATRNVLIEPFLRAMGYDPSNPREIAVEYTADVGKKKGEKIDYAILHEGKPAIMIECKAVGSVLDEGKCSQLLRYFNTSPETRIGVLTDGIKYRFFTDSKKSNIMDDVPFMEIDFMGEYERWLPELERLTKDKWNLGGILSIAESMKYFQGLKKCFSDEIQSPSDEFLRFFIGRVCDKDRIMAKDREKFDPIVKRAIQEHINDLTRQKLRSAMESNKETSDSQAQQIHEDKGNDDIITTSEEIEAYMIIKAILRSIISPKRIIMRDAKSYCSILCDDNNRKPVCRLYFTERKMSLVLFDGDKEERVYIETLDDIYAMGDRLKDTVRKYV